MKIAVDFYHDSLLKDNEVVCGDRIIYSYEENRFLCVLADGLGSGVKANILATMTATILHRMIKEKVPLMEAITTLNETLPECQERKIAYSTFTLLQIENDGKTSLIEFDNPAVNVIRNNEVLHILREKLDYEKRDIYHSEFYVTQNDLFVLMSDGVLYANSENTLNYRWKESDVLKHLIMTTSCHDSASTIGKYLLNTVSSLYGRAPQDDASIAICKVVKQTKSVIMIGPPKNKQYDQEIVDQLNQATGLKMVCGGTTAQIVARHLNQRVVVKETFMHNNPLPPTASIDGIDFVSEGMLTLGRLVDLFVEASNNKQYKESLCETKAQDGAHEMFQLLMLKCTDITFYVGQADNDAHNYLSKALSVNMKNNLVARLAAYLEGFGKTVTIHHV